MLLALANRGTVYYDVTPCGLVGIYAKSILVSGAEHAASLFQKYDLHGKVAYTWRSHLILMYLVIRACISSLLAYCRLIILHDVG